MTAALTPAERFYYQGRGHRVICVDPVAEIHSPLPHRVRHSPGGLAWGNPGPGAADLALSLIVHALGTLAVCPACGGSGEFWDADDDWDDDDEPRGAVWLEVCGCDGGLRPLPYQEFKTQVVARWPAAGWTITRAEILRWLARQYQGDPPEWLRDLIPVQTVELPP
jgi:hypothetical protein